jgi:hypothetical protein
VGNLQKIVKKLKKNCIQNLKFKKAVKFFKILLIKDSINFFPSCSLHPKKAQRW